MKEKELTRLMLGAMDHVEKAGKAICDQKAAGNVRRKGEKDFVTDTDTQVQEILRFGLGKLDRNIQFMGEEQDNGSLDLSQPTWILDPVDGTNNLIHGYRHSAISLALAIEKEVVLGIVYNPFSGDFFTAMQGKGAYLKGKQVHVGSWQALSEGICLVGTNPAYRQNTDLMFARMRRIYDRCLDIRRMGAASLDLCYVACGRAAAYVEEGLCPWDYAAGKLIVEEAGGKVTGTDGGPVRIDVERGSIVAAGGAVYEELMGLL